MRHVLQTAFRGFTTLTPYPWNGEHHYAQDGPSCFSELPHHVVQRGHNRQAVFAADEDYQRYLADLHELKDAFGVKVYAYCLMTNHVHLLMDGSG